MTRPDLRLFGVAVGVWSASLAGLWLTASTGVLVGGAAAAAAGGIGLALRPRGSRQLRTGGAHRDRTRSAAVGWAAVAVAIGAVCGALSTAARVSSRDAEPLATLAHTHAHVRVEATVSDDPRRLAAGAGPPTFLVAARLTHVSAPTVELSVDVAVVVFGSSAQWQPLLPSQRFTAEATLNPARGGDLSAVAVNISGPPTLLDRPSWIQTVAGHLRAGLQAACAGLPVGPAGLLPGLVLGDTSHLDQATVEEFRTTGLTHLVAVSGANLAILLGVVLLLARWCRAGPKLAAAVCLLALVGFVILARPSPSVLRAAGMGVVGLLALAAGRRSAAAPALATTVVACLLWDPALAADAGFALSTVATGALVLLAPRWRDRLCSRGVPRVLAEAISVPAAAQVACGPLIVLLAGGVSLVAIPANLLAAPAVAPATLLGVAATVVHPLWTGGAHGLVWLAMWPARWLLAVAHTGAQIPDATLPWPAGLAGAALLTVITAGLLAGSRWPLATRAVVVGGLAIAVGAVPVGLLASGWPPTGTVLVACDVGQGDALVLPVAAHEAVVVDTGPEPTAVDGCLRRLGITTVDLVVLTHFHLDHVGGISGVLNGRSVGGVLESAYPQPPEGLGLVRSVAAGLPRVTAATGWTYERGGLALKVIGPVSPQTGSRSDPNNNSVVLRVENGGTTLLLAGDAESEEQRELRAADPADLRADVLKVPHHGSSAQDAEFLAAVAPRLALVSVGAGNPYGHPNAAVLARLAGSGALVLRTDQLGDLAVAVTPDGLGYAARGPPD